MGLPTLERRRQLAACALAAALVLALVGAAALLSPQAGDDARRVAAPSTGPSMGTAPAVVPTPAAPTLARGPVPPPLDRARVMELLAGIQAASPITFQPEGGRLTATGEQSLRSVVGLLRDAPDVRVRVVGHSATVRSDPATALRVSQARAEVVAAALRAGGIAAERLAVSGAGDSDPLVTSAASRRVEVSVV